MKLNKIDCAIEAAKLRIQKDGWVITEVSSENEQIHLICVKDGKRRAWGMLDRFTAYSEALKSISDLEIYDVGLGHLK